MMVILAIILGILPGFAWLFFYLREDLHPEPKGLIAFVFVAGMVVTILAFFAQCFAFKNFFFFKSCDVELDVALRNLHLFSGIILIIILALIEEVVKFGAAYGVVNKKTDFNEPVDAMIYMVVIALGFATVENLAIANKILDHKLLTMGVTTVGDAIKTISIRFIGATLLHALASGTVGYYWAKTIRSFGNKRYLLLGLFLATGLHAFFNYLIIKFDDRIYTLVLLIIVGFLIIGDFEKLKRRSI
ncbi:MAG: PrsW family intramembrane metalloprotease [Candidatus Liptonbacteria bacterium]|nr:PrsW family intramembrane metalloprotease [Candidatus Liptonbacteria bacterium]